MGNENFGQWSYDHRDDPSTGENQWVIDSEEHGICTLDAPEDKNESNAKLIAAAPEMYYLLREISEDKYLMGELEAFGFGERVQYVLNKIKG